MIYLDTETCGFTGPIVLIQFAYDDGKVCLYEVWKEPVRRTLNLIDDLCNESGGICAFNLSFDWFHINKLYNLLLRAENKNIPPIVEEIASPTQKEWTEFCCKPQKAFDLLLHARKSHWQFLMTRGEVRFKRIPQDMAKPFIVLLYKKIKLSPLLFAKKKGYTWDIEVQDSNFVDIVTRFHPTLALKPFASEVFHTKFAELSLPPDILPMESDYNPYTTHWQDVIDWHIHHWHTNRNARSYAETDIILLQRLWHWWGEPEINDIDSQLAVCVGAVRWKGFSIDKQAIAERFTKQNEIKNQCPINIDSPQQCLEYLRQPASLKERLVISSTDKATLNELTTWDGEVAQRAKMLQESRKASKECLTLTRLFETDRFCPIFNVVGTRSGRMSGGDIESKLASLNPQGMQRLKEFRKLFTLSDNGEVLSGGDFDSFEVSIAQAASGDQQMHDDLHSGIKFHSVFGNLLYDKDNLTPDEYHKAKTGTFGIFYGAFPQTIAKSCDVSTDVAKKALSALLGRYKEFGKFRLRTIHEYCSMIQPAGIGTPIYWRDSPEYIESLLGFRRYFTLENQICKTLYELANDYRKLPQSFGYVQRRPGKRQSKVGALQSAIYATIFQIQAKNTRVALNHIIQSTGGEITKCLQLAIWDKQPAGIHTWVVRPFNEHDEVMVVHDSNICLKYVVDEVIEKYREVVPLLSMTWKNGLKNWGEK